MSNINEPFASRVSLPSLVGNKGSFINYVTRDKVRSGAGAGEGCKSEKFRARRVPRKGKIERDAGLK